MISSSHKGIATTITDSTIARAPTLNRNFTDFLALVPQISTKGPGNSGGGQNNRFNAIQIDGSVANDLFGLSSTLQPGGQASGRGRHRPQRGCWGEGGCGCGWRGAGTGPGRRGARSGAG